MGSISGKSSLFFFIVLYLLGYRTQAQGCVAIRYFSSCVGTSLEANQLQPGNLQLGVNNRYFKSFRHFRGTTEEPDRVTDNTEVIKGFHEFDKK